MKVKTVSEPALLLICGMISVSSEVLVIVPSRTVKFTQKSELSLFPFNDLKSYWKYEYAAEPFAPV